MPRHSITGSTYSATNGTGGTGSSGDGSHGMALVIDFYKLDWGPDGNQAVDPHIGAGHLRHGNGRIPDNRVDELAAKDSHLKVDGVRVLVAAISPRPLFTDNGGTGQLYIDLRNYKGASNQDFQSDENISIIEMLLHGDFGGPFEDFSNFTWKTTKLATIDISGADLHAGTGAATIEVTETPSGGGTGGNLLHTKFKITPFATQGRILHAANVTNFTWSGGDIGDLHFDGQGEVSIDFVQNWPE